MKLLTDKTAGELVRHLKAAAPDPTRRARIAHGAIPSPPRPFACRLAADTADGAGEGTKALFCYLPPETAEAVRYGGEVVPADQTLGTSENPWVRVADGDATSLYLCLSFSFGSDGDATATGWTLSTSIPAAPAGGALWPHLVWALETGIGAVQYHLGSLSLGSIERTGEEEFLDVPSCGHPLNEAGSDDSDENDVHPLDSPARQDSSDGVVNISPTDHPLDGEGEGGYTPLCKEDLERGEETQPE